jgi:formate transporter
MYFLTAGMLVKSNPAFVQASGLSPDKIINGAGIINNLIPVTLGNIVGGAVLVGFTYYATYKYSPSKIKDSSCDVKAS